ncbi:MAG: hypothetical protein WD696_10745 [Bryobacteraceae bacterium]
MISPRSEKLVLSAILLALLAALVWQAWSLGVTVDEPAHIIAARLYWEGKARAFPGDLPPLIKIAAGWVPALLELPIPYEETALWEARREWFIAQRMMERIEPSHTQRIFFQARLPLLVFPLLTALLLWRWSRQLFPPAVALIVTALFALEPTALGHGALLKNDLAATFGYLLFWYRAWRLVKSPRMANAAWLGAGLLLALLGKLSMLFLALVAPLIVLWAFRNSRRTLPAALAAVTLGPYLGLLAASQFQTRRIPARELEVHAVTGRLPAPFLLAAQVFRVLPVPTPVWNGVVSIVQSNRNGSPVYLLGDVYERGHRLYFAAALAWKIPEAIQMLLLGGLALCLLQRDREAFWWLVPPLLYIGLASLSSLQFGVRLVLPALPFGLLLSGKAAAWLMKGRRIVALAALLAWMTLASVPVYPHGISYFNGWAGGPENGLPYLADSNIDWGQDLPQLADYVRRKGIAKLHLSYFGSDIPWRFFSDEQAEQVAPPWTPKHAEGLKLKPRPGYWAISANLLPGHFFRPEYRQYFEAFRKMKPIARAGYSIYIYKVP